MYHTLLGPEGFRKGTDLYFKRHDGQVGGLTGGRGRFFQAGGQVERARTYYFKRP